MDLVGIEKETVKSGYKSAPVRRWYGVGLMGDTASIPHEFLATPPLFSLKLLSANTRSTIRICTI